MEHSESQSSVGKLSLKYEQEASNWLALRHVSFKPRAWIDEGDNNHARSPAPPVAPAKLLRAATFPELRLSVCFRQKIR